MLHGARHFQPPRSLFLTLCNTSPLLVQVSERSSWISLTAYNLVKEYSGQNFFNGWDFYGNYDNLTSGVYHYVTFKESSVDVVIIRRCHLGRPGECDPVSPGVCQ